MKTNCCDQLIITPQIIFVLIAGHLWMLFVIWFLSRRSSINWCEAGCLTVVMVRRVLNYGKLCCLECFLWNLESDYSDSPIRLTFCFIHSFKYNYLSAFCRQHQKQIDFLCKLTWSVYFDKTLVIGIWVWLNCSVELGYGFSRLNLLTLCDI